MEIRYIQYKYKMPREMLVVHTTPKLQVRYSPFSEWEDIKTVIQEITEEEYLALSLNKVKIY